MSLGTNLSYTGSSAEFWTSKQDNLTVVGDYLGRLPSIKLLKPEKGMRILDAGCGAGFVTRMVARTGAQTYGCDNAETMLAAARASEVAKPLGIQYRWTDISKVIPYADQFFDGIISTGVLIHLSVRECADFFREARRVLKSRGRLVVSLTHNKLPIFTEWFPKESEKWVRHEALSSKDERESRRYREYYRNVEGRVFESEVWAHPEYVLIDVLRSVGFEIVKHQTMYVTQEVLDTTGQKGDVGVPGFWQILVRAR